MAKFVFPLWFVLLLALAACAPAPTPGPPQEAATGSSPVEATSLLGESLYRPELDPDFAAQQAAYLAEAQENLAAHPEDPMAWIWVGRRTAYLGRYREALEIYTEGIEAHPEAPRLYRHRGHRYITVREFDRAVADLERAAELLRDRQPEVEPDGLPNALNQPTGTTHSSTWYHLGLAHYLQGDFEAALLIYREGLGYSDNPDMQVATTYWLYRTLRRLGQEEEAAAVLEPISAELELIENHDYLELLLLAKGERTPEELLAGQEGLSAATLRYGIGAWYREQGDGEKALAVFREILEGDAWAAFGYIAAEAEVAEGAEVSSYSTRSNV